MPRPGTVLRMRSGPCSDRSGQSPSYIGVLRRYTRDDDYPQDPEIPMRRHILAPALLALTLMPYATQAGDFDFDFGQGSLSQADFKSVAEDIAATFNSKSLAPAEAMGITGFGIGVFASYVKTDDSGAWQRLIGENVDEIGLVGIVAQKGLPFGIDVGASYSQVPGEDAKLFGAEIRYAFLEGGVATPGLGVRASYSKLSGVDEIDYDSFGMDLSISKGFGPLTPYAGVGYVWSKISVEDETADVALDNENVDEARVFIGLRLSALFGITPEYERVGDRNAYNVRLGFAF